jgi:hypothetical protein
MHINLCLTRHISIEGLKIGHIDVNRDVLIINENKKEMKSELMAIS